MARQATLICEPGERVQGNQVQQPTNPEEQVPTQLIQVPLQMIHAEANKKRETSVSLSFLNQSQD
jgi:hypothetical protein